MERELTATRWRGYAQQQFPQAAWSVDGDVLRVIASGPRVDLISRESFRDFVLYFDWRLPRGGSTAVAYRGSEEIGAAAHTGDRKSTRLDSRHSQNSYALFCFEKKKKYK